jgi:iron complex outermembrane receptor protein
LPPLEPKITNSVEVGYRGRQGSRFQFAIDAHRTWVEHFVGHLRVITPNVFLDPASLQAYLAQFMSGGAADTLARSLAEIPLGTVTPQEAKDPADLIFAVRNFGSVAFWGVDATCLAQLTDRLSIAGTYSWVSDDMFQDVGGLEDLAMNAPTQKGAVAVAYRDPVKGLASEVRFRATAGFPVVSGVYVGDVERYGLVDFLVSCRISGSPRMALTASAENALDDRHQEFIGAPEIGRVVCATRAEF